jgi:hypothetical protein
MPAQQTPFFPPSFPHNPHSWPSCILHPLPKSPAHTSTKIRLIPVTAVGLIGTSATVAARTTPGTRMSAALRSTLDV